MVLTLGVGEPSHDSVSIHDTEFKILKFPAVSHILRKAFIFYLLEEFVEDRSENSKSTFIIIYSLSVFYKPINSTYKKARGAQQFILNSLRNMYWRRISLGLKCLNPIVDP